MASKKACMICGKEKAGIDVQEDWVITAMRWFKENITHNAKGYKIVVCKECMPKYAKMRSKFQRRQMFYVGLGIVFTLTIAIVSGGRYLGIISYGIVITLFLYALSLVSYVPGLKRPASTQDSPKSRR
jgi:hypothetical protein